MEPNTQNTVKVENIEKTLSEPPPKIQNFEVEESFLSN